VVNPAGGSELPSGFAVPQKPLAFGRLTKPVRNRRRKTYVYVKRNSPWVEQPPKQLVALEQYLPSVHRVIDDGLAARLLPFAGRAFVGLLRMHWMRDWMIALSKKSNPGIWGGLWCRKRYVDEMLVTARNELQQVVNLGAGFDTRAYRLPSLSGVPFWEIDQYENTRAKGSQLRKVFGAVPSTSAGTSPRSGRRTTSRIRN